MQENWNTINVVQAFKFKFPRFSGAASLSNSLSQCCYHTCSDFWFEKNMVTRGSKKNTNKNKKKKNPQPWMRPKNCRVLLFLSLEFWRNFTRNNFHFSSSLHYSHIKMFNFTSLTTSPFNGDENRSVHVIRYYTLLLHTVTKLGALVQQALSALTLTPPPDV